MALSPEGKNGIERLLGSRRMSSSGATLARNAAGEVRLWERRHPAERELVCRRSTSAPPAALNHYS